MIKSPLRYPGGKSKALKFLKEHLCEAKELREPFFGGGSVGIFYHQTYGTKIIASDINYEVYCFWNQLKINGLELIANIEEIKQTEGRVLYNELIARRTSKLSELERARDFFALNRITFSGLADAGGYSDESFHKRFTSSSIERLRKIQPLLSKFDFLNCDYEETIVADGNDVLVFADPPYYSVAASKLYGKEGILHLNFDHQRLYEVLNKTPHNWILTIDNCDYIKNLYQNFKIIEWNHQYSMNNYKQTNAAIGKELLITNF